MRILQLAPPWESVPPAGYGGTEAVVHLLTEELVRRGHDVTLYASGDSQTSARHLWTVYQSLRTGDYEHRAPRELLHVAQALALAPEFDIVHNHAGEVALAMSLLIDAPMLTTMHCAIVPDTLPIWEAQRGYYNTISRSQTSLLPHGLGGTFLGPVHNAIDVASFPFSAEPGDYLLFLSRLSPEKGTELAIEVARRLGQPLIIAGKVDPADRRYYEEVVEPLIDGDLIRYVGEAGPARKRELYLGARCVLLPLCWEEPFGLVMPEAMACGRPVVALARGAAPEIIRHGETGFLASDLDDFIDAVRRVGEIDPHRCRAHVQERFDVPYMVDNYLRLYDEMLVRERRRDRLLEPPGRGAEPLAAPTAVAG